MSEYVVDQGLEEETYTRRVNQEFTAAMVKVQSELTGAKKDTANPFFKSKYADLSSVWDAIREPLTHNGFAVLQHITTDKANGMVDITTVVRHVGGGVDESTLSIPYGQPTAQNIGSAITYGRRYGLQSIIGICPEDDDGQNATVGATPHPPPTAPPATKTAAPITTSIKEGDATEGQRKMVWAKLNKIGCENDAAIHTKLTQILKRPIASTKELNRGDIKPVVDFCEALEKTIDAFGGRKSRKEEMNYASQSDIEPF